MNDQDRIMLLAAADDFGVPLASYVTDAQKLHAAAVSYVADVETMPEPNLANIAAPKDIGPVIDALLAWPHRDERLRHARRVEVETRTQLNAAADRFRAVLFPALAPIFRTAAADFTARYQAGEQQDPKTVATLHALVRVRDLLAGPVDQGFPMTHSDEPTRVLTWRTRNDMIRLRRHDNVIDRGGQPWIERALSLGATLTWQEPAEQIAHVKALPTGERPIATTPTAGGAAA